MRQLINNFNVSENGVHVGVIDFSHEARIRVDLNSNEGKRIGAITKALDSLETDYRLKGWTRTGLALTEAYKMFKNILLSRRVPKLLVVITDGKSAFGKKGLEGPIKDLKNISVTTYSVAIGNKVNDEELMLMANGIKDRVLNVSSFDNLARYVRTLRESLCSGRLRQIHFTFSDPSYMTCGN